LVRSTLRNDTDGDQMSDEWELDNFGDLTRSGEMVLDSDGSNDLQEFWSGTNPKSAEDIPLFRLWREAGSTFSQSIISLEYFQRNDLAHDFFEYAVSSDLMNWVLPTSISRDVQLIQSNGTTKLKIRSSIQLTTWSSWPQAYVQLKPRR